MGYEKASYTVMFPSAGSKDREQTLLFSVSSVCLAYSSGQ